MQLTSSAVLLDNLEVLAPGSGLAVDLPEVMEEYGQRFVPYRRPFVLSMSVGALSF